MPSSAFHVVEQTPFKLVITSPPYYSQGIIFLVVAIWAAASGFLVPRGMHQWPRYAAFAVALPMLVASLVILTSRAEIVLSRETGKLAFGRSVLGMTREHAEVRLEEIRRVAVQAGGRGTQRLIAVLDGGQEVPLSAFTSQAGKDSSAAAINEFLQELSQPK